MKKILAGFFVSLLVLAPSFTFAQTTSAAATTYSSQYIQLLQQLLQLLEQELATVLAQQGSTTNTGSTQTPSGAQIYSSTQYGFSFNYAPVLIVTPISKNYGEEVTVNNSTQSNSSPIVQVIASTNSTQNIDCTGSEAASIVSSVASSLGVTSQPVQNTINIGGVSFASVSLSSVSNGEPVSFATYDTLHNGNCYVISMASTPTNTTASSEATVQAQQQQILQSFSIFAPTPTQSQITVTNALSTSNNQLEDGVRQSNVDYLQSMLDVYYSENNTYPGTLTQLQASLPSLNRSSVYDPVTNQLLSYTATGNSYSICATLSTGIQYCKTSTNTTNSQSNVSTVPTNGASIDPSSLIGNLNYGPNTITGTAVAGVTSVLVYMPENSYTGGYDYASIALANKGSNLSQSAVIAYPYPSNVVNGRWSAYFGGGLSLGTYRVLVYDAVTHALLTTGNLVVSNTPSAPTTSTTGIQFDASPTSANAVATLLTGGSTAQVGTFTIVFNVSDPYGSSPIYFSPNANTTVSVSIKKDGVVTSVPLTTAVSSNAQMSTNGNFEILPGPVSRTVTVTGSLHGVTGNYSMVLNSFTYGTIDNAPAANTATLPSTYQTPAVMLQGT
jgi:hypothetical protein